MHEISSQLPIWGALISSPPHKCLKEKKNNSYLSPWIYMQISCFIQSSILTPYVWILSNDLDISEPNFVTKIPNFRSSKGPKKKCFLIRELQMRNYFIGIMFLHKFDIINRNLNGLFQKVLPRCDEIMRRDEIRWFDGIQYGTVDSQVFITIDWSHMRNTVTAQYSAQTFLRA